MHGGWHLKVARILLEQPAEIPEKFTDVVFLQGCNLHCPTCLNPSLIPPDGPGQDMSMNQIFENCQKTVSEVIALSGGEPLLHWKELVQDPTWFHVKKHYNKEVVMFTNGLLLSTVPHQILMYFDHFFVDLKPLQYIPDGRYCQNIDDFYHNTLMLAWTYPQRFHFSIVPSPEAVESFLFLFQKHPYVLKDITLRQTPFTAEALSLINEKVGDMGYDIHIHIK